jgi:hypothetical protein
MAGRKYEQSSTSSRNLLLKFTQKQKNRDSWDNIWFSQVKHWGYETISTVNQVYSVDGVDLGSESKKRHFNSC